MADAPAPVVLAANQPARPYRGGPGIARLRGIDSSADNAPEDFVGSTTEIFDGGGIGLTRLPDGQLLINAIEANPVGYLGPDHLARFGASTELLVKILDTAERLFVHFHPDDAFAHAHLGLAHGKTEAWIVVDTDLTHEPEPHAHLGFTRSVSETEVSDWVNSQNVGAMLEAMNRVPLRAGTTLLVPAGVPHSIGPFVTLVELQQPTDLSVLLEYLGFDGVSEQSAFLGLDRDLALSALDRRPWTPEQISDLTSRIPTENESSATTGLLPIAADPFFRAEWIEVVGSARIDPGYSVLVVVAGGGQLVSAAGPMSLVKGMTVLLPHGAGDVTLQGSLSIVRCRPPAA